MESVKISFKNFEILKIDFLQFANSILENIQIVDSKNSDKQIINIFKQK